MVITNLDDGHINGRISDGSVCLNELSHSILTEFFFSGIAFLKGLTGQIILHHKTQAVRFQSYVAVQYYDCNSFHNILWTFAASALD